MFLWGFRAGDAEVAFIDCSFFVLQSVQYGQVEYAGKGGLVQSASRQSGAIGDITMVTSICSVYLLKMSLRKGYA